MEERVASALERRATAEESERAAADLWLESLDRFLEPNVRRAIAATEDPVVRRSGEEVLSSLQRD
jgi:hypothetical protein